MNIVNCTPHEVRVYSSASATRLAEAAKRAADGSVSVWETALAEETPLAVFPPSGALIRVAQTRRDIGMLNGIPVNTSEFGQVGGLPEPQPDTWYIVSGLVLSAAPDRPDLLVPAPPVRDWQGRVVGCAGFDANPAAERRLAGMALPLPAPNEKPDNQEATYSVMLTSPGNRFVDLVNTLRDAGIEFSKAKALVRNAEYYAVTIVQNISLSDARNLALAIAGAGGEAKIVDAD